MHHDDLKGRGIYPHWKLDNLLPSHAGYAIDDCLCLESALTAPGTGTAASRVAWDTDFSLYLFPNTAARHMQTAVQLPHSYKNGTDLLWHVHFIPTSQVTNGQTVKFNITYRAATLNSVFSAKASASSTFTSIGTTAADTSCKAKGAVIDGAALSGSSFIIATVTRDYANDTFNGDVLLIGADYHIQKERIGSATEAAY